MNALMISGVVLIFWGIILSVVPVIGLPIILIGAVLLIVDRKLRPVVCAQKSDPAAQ